MSIPSQIDPLGTDFNEIPYVQPQYKTDLSGIVIEPSVPTTITRTGWSGEPTERNTYNPFYSFFGRMTTVGYNLGNSWYGDGQRMIIDFEKPVKVTSVKLLPIQYFSGRYLKGYNVKVDGIEVGSVSGLGNENPVVWHNVKIESPRYGKRLELVFSVNNYLGITQVMIEGVHRQ